MGKHSLEDKVFLKTQRILAAMADDEQRWQDCMRVNRQRAGQDRIRWAVTERLDAIGAYWRWLNQCTCIVCYKGMFFSIDAGREPTEKHNLTRQEICDAGGQVLMIDSEAAARNMFADVHYPNN
jgi:hypothetical protein